AGAVSSVAITIGAPQRCVTLWRAVAAYNARARTLGRHKYGPATTQNVPRKTHTIAWETRQRPRKTLCFSPLPRETVPHGRGDRRRGGDRPRPWDRRWCRKYS